MALTKCPECGNTISDKAEKCPHCGCPLKPVKEETSTVVQEKIEMSAASVQATDKPQKKPKKPTSKKVRTLILIVLALAVLVIIGRIISPLLPAYVKVDDINISKWKVSEQSTYYDVYTATVTSDAKKPFVAIIGYYKSEYNILDDGTAISPVPNLVYMENGEGKFETIETDDDADPSLKRVPVGYLPCKTLSQKDIKNISFSVGEYSDYTDSTSCSIDYEIELKNNATGILIFDVTNDMTKGTDTDCNAVIIDGKGSGSIWLSDLPAKSRGVEAEIHPKAFCTAKTISDSDYTTDKEFSVEKTEGAYSTYFNGEMQMRFGDACENGLVLYTSELVEGGRTTDRGEVTMKLSAISNHIVDIKTYDYCTNGEKYITPQYDINVVAYISYKELQ